MKNKQRGPSAKASQMPRRLHRGGDCLRSWRLEVIEGLIWIFQASDHRMVRDTSRIVAQRWAILRSTG